jgi:signal transduction histidine kinase
MRRTIPVQGNGGYGLLQAQLEFLLGAVADGVILTHAGKAKPNAAACRLLGLPAGAQLDEIELLSIVSPAPGGGVRLRATGPDGTERLLEGTLSTIGPDANAIMFREPAEADGAAPAAVNAYLVARGKLAALGELAAGVAHEINNPLFGILGLTEFLLKEAEPGTKAHERLCLIQQTGLEIKEIVRALLEFARENPDERRDLVLEDTVRSTVELLRRTNAHKGVEIVDSYESARTRVNASANQLKQIFLNLIANAREAMRAGGTVRISVRREGGEAVVCVSDDGAGIEPAVAERAFEPFFTTRRERGAAGLGLATSLGIAEAHGGCLTLESTPGAGATFTLRLPVAETAA